MKSRWMRWVGHVAYMEEKGSILGVKGQRLLGRTRHSWGIILR